MSIYTGAGDGGKTSLLSGERVSKADLRVEAYGEVDELNAVLGVLIAGLDGAHAALIPELQRIQTDLFAAGAWLSVTSDAPIVERLVPFTAEHSARLERAIDRMEAELPRLRAFVLPGGHPSAAWAHLARTVCRRAERHIVRLIEARAEYEGDSYPESIGTEQGLAAPKGLAQKARTLQDRHYRQIVIYINRLSDYLFVLARYLNQLAGTPDLEWRSQ